MALSSSIRDAVPLRQPVAREVRQVHAWPICVNLRNLRI